MPLGPITGSPNGERGQSGARRSEARPHLPLRTSACPPSRWVLARRRPLGHGLVSGPAAGPLAGSAPADRQDRNELPGIGWRSYGPHRVRLPSPPADQSPDRAPRLHPGHQRASGPIRPWIAVPRTFSLARRRADLEAQQQDVVQRTKVNWLVLINADQPF